MFKQIAVLLLLSGRAAFADQAPSAAPVRVVTPTPSAAAAIADPRIRRYVYNENSVYRLDLYLKSVTALQFSPGEEVESILIGDSASWEVVKLKAGNVVSVKPTLPSTSTNMTIYTDRRVYTFELRSVGEFASGATAAPLFRSVFTYPADRKPKQDNDDTFKPDSLRADYMFSGNAPFRPRWAQDNGRQTMFFLSEGAPRPAVFKVAADNKEQLVNSRTKGNQIIVDGTSDYWILRIGDQSVCVGRASAVKVNRNVTVN
ncbi:TrbG/VirB9 family P-type conjugative transfer protein [Rhizobium sp. NLR22b]|uniref:TrbG/VirB9 family P-type conjugative transfer protein n=1 Tax=Rhizobium sp. NLR22b TaxID=2731115 RepID=UPI001C83F581|nr:TrbG/VirB9 family P-type conjugative transfer protein [Rhizobium sp. NLR22b]MBX5242786.1 TrbG/VirB9 family P-type conjugative transfer protein [Rhizobium sp. NLR22b]